MKYGQQTATFNQIKRPLELTGFMVVYQQNLDNGWFYRKSKYKHKEEKVNL